MDNLKRRKLNPTAVIPTRPFGKTGWDVTEVCFGAWQLGGQKGCWEHCRGDEESIAALHAYIDAGGNLIDTANVYGSGHSEVLIAKVFQERRDADKKDQHVYVITKAGRAHGDVETPLSKNPHSPENYTYDALLASVEGSLRRLQVEKLDLLQLHCPPKSVLEEGKVFGDLNKLKEQGKIGYWGVSVETCEEALLAINQPNCASVQIIFNVFRHKPKEKVLSAAKSSNVAIIARVPLASGLLSGKVDSAYVDSLSDKDHRVFNKSGACFDKGETWSGLGEVLESAAFPALEKLRVLVPEDSSMAQLALKWILQHPEVSVVIPGCRCPSHVESNIASSQLKLLEKEKMETINKIYDDHIREHVHAHW